MAFNRAIFRLTLRMVVLLIGVATTGCTSSVPEDDLPRQPVAGTVLVDGRPLGRGAIFFFPAHRDISNSSISSGGVIENGRFSLPWAQGLVPGEYRVAISSGGSHAEQDQRKADPKKLEFDPNETIPARFNTQTELAFEVKEGGIKHMKIAIDSK
jgi:hypothetical protein